MTKLQTELILVSRPEPWIAIITLNRESDRNAISRALATSFLEMTEALARADDLRAVILTGAGEKAFSSGADLKERHEMTPRQRFSHTEQIWAMAECIASFPVPIIAALRGYALAGGAELAIACDLKVGGESTIFGFPEVKRGIFPGAGGVQRLPRLVGPSHARRLLFTGRQIDSDEAFRIGLLDALVPDDYVMTESMRLAREIAAQSPAAIRALKRAILAVENEPLDQASSIVKEIRGELDTGEDYDEGLAAFAENREPRWNLLDAD